MSERLYIVVPCYNEEAVLHETAARLQKKLERLIALNKIAPHSRILFVDDGSKDATWKMIAALHQQNPLFSGLKLSRNQGHQHALLAGLMAAKERADIAISMDADLQDDINAVDVMLEKYSAGCDIVYGVRSSRASDTVFKRVTAQGYYWLMEKMGVHLVYNHADYRLMSQRALRDLSEFKEVNLFLRGLVPLIGYRTAIVKYVRGERFAGESKYPLRKMLAFALDGITSFSTQPIRMITFLGFLIFLVSILFILYTLLVKLTGYTVDGWSTLHASIWLLGGLQLLALGMIGEYIGKIYSEVKARPHYTVETLLDQTVETDA